jgi:hypothetical protein
MRIAQGIEDEKAKGGSGEKGKKGDKHGKR